MNMNNNRASPLCDDSIVGVQLGITMRDYFATAAMSAVILDMVSNEGNKLDYVAEVAYAMADAMMVEREKQNG